MTDLQTATDFDSSDLMTPEELAMLKKLQEKRKAQQKQMGSIKDSLFISLTENFGPLMSKIKKDVVTVNTKIPFADGNRYAITFGMDVEETEELDTAALAVKIMEASLDKVEPIMGISNSLKLTGEYEGKKLFWQVRKFSKTDKD